MSDIVLVTGAGGFVGRAAVRALAAAGCTVRAGYRRPPADALRVDVLDRASLDAAMAGVGTVVHCAVGGPRDTSVIVEGTRNTLAAAQAAGVERFIQLSSVAVYGATEGLVAEDAAIDHPSGDYGAAKVVAEALCREATAAMAVAILRPSLIYGRDSTQWTTLYLDRLRSGRWPALAEAGEGTANLVHVDDLAGFIAHLATSASPIAGTFNVNGADLPTWNGYLDALRHAIGAPAPTRTGVPGGALLTARKGAKAAAMLLGGAGLPHAALDRFVALTPSADEVARFRTHTRYAIDRMIASGYRPRIDLAAGVADIAGGART